MTQTLQIYDGEFGAPSEPAANSRFHQAILDRLMARARDAGWNGAEFHSYYREQNRVCIGIAPGADWPGLDALRASMDAIRLRPEPEDFAFQGDGQGRMF
jgi:hypothetical protein